MIRVIGGEHRGRMLRTPPGPGTRPATGRVRESVFSTLGMRVREAHVLDLYAGSGSFGIEALSRGGRSALFVERSRPALEALRSNLKSLGITDEARVVAARVERQPRVAGKAPVICDRAECVARLDCVDHERSTVRSDSGRVRCRVRNDEGLAYTN